MDQDYGNSSSHIITASNVQVKKLSFKGWERCVEVFSQGKGHLSYHCSRLVHHLEPSQEEVISWSSSDGESDDNSQRHRQRPNRTLASQINFDNCVSSRKRGRRRTCAKFSRALEKRLDESSVRMERSSLNHNTSHCKINETQDQEHSEEVEFSNRNDTQLSEVSLLNRRLNICDSQPDLTLNSSSLDLIIKTTPVKNSEEIIETLSPVLKVQTMKKRSKTCKISPEKPSVLNKKNEGNDCSYSEPVSPPLKVKHSVQKWKQRRVSFKITGTNEVELAEGTDIVTETNNPIVRTSETNVNDTPLKSRLMRSPTLMHSPARDFSRASWYEEKETSDAGSPIIGKSNERSRKRVRTMPVDQLLSPILGSGKRTSNVKKRKQEQPSSTMRLVQSESFEKYAPQHLDASLLSPARHQLAKDNEESVDRESLGTAKRSLDFSRWLTDRTEQQSEIGRIPVESKEKETSFHKSDSEIETLSHLSSTEEDVIESSQPNWENSSMSRKHQNSVGNQVDRSVKQYSEPTKTGKVPSEQFITPLEDDCSSILSQNNAQASVNNCDETICFSEQIEEINTEQITIDSSPKVSAIPVKRVGRKSLSLSKRVALKNFNCTSEQGLRDRIEIGNTSPLCNQKLPKSNNLINHKDRPPTRWDCNNADRNFFKNIEISSKASSTSTKSVSNMTCFIEEINTETLDETQHDVRECGNELLVAENPSPTKSVIDDDDASDCDPLNIDSCSSQSPEEVFPTQIEVDQPSSPSLLSPFSISQSASPPTPSVPRQVTEKADEFNAPPKKGRNKLKAGGLASRLQRLLHRQRSSLRIWQFKRGKQISRQGSSESSGSGSEKRVEGTGSLISVSRTWTEYSHLVVHGQFFHESKNNTSSLSSSLAGPVVVILDPYIVDRLGRIMTASVIRIFPPWQALRLRGITVILCASCVEIAGLDSADAQEARKELKVLKEFSCPCVRGSGPEACTDHTGLWMDAIISNGDHVSIMDLMFSKEKNDAASLLSCGSDTGNLDQCEGSSTSKTQDSVAELVMNHCAGSVNPCWISITVLRVFQFLEATQTNSQNELNPTWSLMGQDSTGVICDVVLGPGFKFLDSTLMKEMESYSLLGKVCRFQGLIPVQRISPLQKSALWNIARSMPMLSERCLEQTVLYVLSPGHVSFRSHIVQQNDNIQDSCFFKLLSLGSVMAEVSSYSESRRVSIPCRLVCATKERLYVTDIETAPNITVIRIKPTVHVPTSLSKVSLILMNDLCFAQGELTADKYSQIVAMNVAETLRKQGYSSEECCHMASLNPLLPEFSYCSAVRTLALLSGTIVGVDEESAFMWPACGACGNELLTFEEAAETYKCEKCQGPCDQLTLRMSLQVIVSCPNFPPDSVIRVKLTQGTIENLLPPSPSNDDGYDMNAVLGHQLGPLRCEVLSAGNGFFTLQEL